MVDEKGFTEPKLAIFKDQRNIESSQGLIITEKELLFEVDINGFSVVDGLIALLAAYYIFM